MSTTDWIRENLLLEIPEGSSVLDVGAGMAKYHKALGWHGCELTLLDAHEPYLLRAKKNLEEICGPTLVISRAERFLRAILPGSFSFILGIDFIEHLERDTAVEVIEHMKRVAAKAVILFVPEGNHPQDEDLTGMGAHELQTHRSTWYAEDLRALDFGVDVWPDAHAGQKGKDPGALWCVWRRPEAPE